MAAATGFDAGSYNDYLELDASRNTMFIIDPQQDFHAGGSLGNPAANADAERIAALLSAHIGEVDDLIVSLDTHQRLHIAHGLFWVDADGNHPPPNTPITHEAVQNGTWRTSDPRFQAWGLEYTRQLETAGKNVLFIWPAHCVMGTAGHSVVDELMPALEQWAEQRTRAVEFVPKGHNMLTEHYSAMKADVVRDDDPRTQFNTRIFERLRKADRVIVCGQAMSHCVKFTMLDILDAWPEAERAKLVLLTDCASPVATFEDAATAFVEEMRQAGCTVTTSTELAW